MPVSQIPAEFLDFLRRSGLIGDADAPACTALTGGVSSDIWKIDLPAGPICVKRALGKLKVADDWRAPIERNAYETAWMQTAGAIAPGCAPEVLAHDSAVGMFAMPYLDPARCRLWKTELRDGRVDPDFAGRCGTVLGQIHVGTMNDDAVADRFATDDIFHAIRLEPYLEATARRHPDIAPALHDLVSETAAHKIALVHGDVSPKNILIAPEGPLFLDAECAWYGDPAFDLAFCLNHFLLKCLWRPTHTDSYLTSFEAMTDAYREAVDGSDDDRLLVRAGRLLPGLFLARVDGKSPVEYITDEAAKDRVRKVAKRLLADPVDTPLAVGAAWREEMRM